MTTTLVHPHSAHLIDGSSHLIDDYLTSTYVPTIDAGIEAASEALRAIDPMSSHAKRLSALGVDDRAVASSTQPPVYGIKLRAGEVIRVARMKRRPAIVLSARVDP